jgi:hypothetical protein
MVQDGINTTTSLPRSPYQQSGAAFLSGHTQSNRATRSVGKEDEDVRG